MLRLNGVAYPTTVAPFDLADRGLTLGDGLFETIAVFGGRPAALDAHLDRLMAAASELRLPLDRARLHADVLALAGEGDAVIRLTATRGTGARGLAIPADAAPAIIVTRGAFPKAALFAPLRLAAVAVRRNPTSFAARAKTLAYLDNVMAYDAALAAGADDALMLNTDGRVACTAMANLFAVFGRELVTPPVSDGVLPGIVRRMALDAAETLGLAPTQRSLAPEALRSADAVFATNSVRLVMPVTAIDGVALSDPRGVVRRMQSVVGQACGAGAQGSAS